MTIAIERDGTVITPRGRTTIDAGDAVTVFVHGGVDPDLESVFPERESAVS